MEQGRLLDLGRPVLLTVLVPVQDILLCSNLSAPAAAKLENYAKS